MTHVVLYGHLTTRAGYCPVIPDCLLSHTSGAHVHARRGWEQIDSTREYGFRYFQRCEQIPRLRLGSILLSRCKTVSHSELPTL